GSTVSTSTRHSSLNHLPLPAMSLRPLLRQEMPWLISELVLLVVLMNANAPELWFWLVVFLVLIFYRLERWWSSRPD
ncbi:MAG: hypothetical protein AB8B70_05015, partial [Prochlorococcus sp.]